MNKETFLKKYGITDDQFTGKEKINCDLYLRSLTSIPEGFNPTVGGVLYLSSLTSIPEGFNPTVGGDLDLDSLTSIPEGFNPTVGGSLYLRSLTSIPEGFNPTVGGSLYLNSLTSIPEGFNPTVGGSLYLRSLTSIPEGFNPTVGGWLDLNNGSKYIGATVYTNLFWQKNGRRYAKIDGLFCQILSEKTQTLQGKEYKLFSAKRIAKDETFFIVKYEGFYSHGNDIHKAVSDLQFKINAEKIKKEPILPDTTITVNHYRIITGACELGCKQWMEQNNITADSITAKELLPILEKTNAYGLQKFKNLINW